jgi:D-lactate dehydrogenase (cytochrome)
VVQVIQLGVPIARCEFVDHNTVRINTHSKLGLREQPHLLLEFHGSRASVKEQAERCRRSRTNSGAKAFQWADTPEERTRLWTARHNAYFAALQLQARAAAASPPMSACPSAAGRLPVNQ